MTEVFVLSLNGAPLAVYTTEERAIEERDKDQLFRTTGTHAKLVWLEYRIKPVPLDSSVPL